MRFCRFSRVYNVCTNSVKSGVTALGKDIKEAKAKAYRAVENIHFEGCQYRRDIAHRAN